MVLFSEGAIGQKIGFYLKQRWASPSQNSDSSRLELHFVEDSDSTRTREFGDIDSIV
jgi:hypothetical protein